MQGAVQWLQRGYVSILAQQRQFCTSTTHVSAFKVLLFPNPDFNNIKSVLLFSTGVWIWILPCVHRWCCCILPKLSCWCASPHLFCRALVSSFYWLKICTTPAAVSCAGLYRAWASVTLLEKKGSAVGALLRSYCFSDSWCLAVVEPCLSESGLFPYQWGWP